MLHNMAAVNKPSTEACWSEIAAAAEALLLPTAIPTSAAAKATKSLMPSPTYITVLPKPCIQESSHLMLNSVDMHFSCLRLLDFTCPSRAHPVLAGRMPISARAAKSLMPSPQCKHDLPNPWTSTFLRPHSFELAAIISTWLLYNHGLKQARNNNQHCVCWQTSSMQGLNQVCWLLLVSWIQMTAFSALSGSQPVSGMQQLCT